MHCVLPALRATYPSHVENEPVVAAVTGPIIERAVGGALQGSRCRVVELAVRKHPDNLERAKSLLRGAGDKGQISATFGLGLQAISVQTPSHYPL